jgi:hypothetical protein
VQIPTDVKMLAYEFTALPDWHLEKGNQLGESKRPSILVHFRWNSLTDNVDCLY